MWAKKTQRELRGTIVRCTIVKRLAISRVSFSCPVVRGSTRATGFLQLLWGKASQKELPGGREDNLEALIFPRSFEREIADEAYAEETSDDWSAKCAQMRQADTRIDFRRPNSLRRTSSYCSSIHISFRRGLVKLPETA